MKNNADIIETAWNDPNKIARDTIVASLRRLCSFDAARVLDVGAGEAGYRKLFENRCVSYTTFDLERAAKPAIVGSAMALPIRSACFDTVVSTQTLEHLPLPVVALKEIRRVLKPTGRLILTVPQVWPLHMEPNDYFRFTRYGIEVMLASVDLTIERIEPCGGLIATICQHLVFGADYLGGHARRSRVRHLWRRRILPLINRIALKYDNRSPKNDGNVLNWAVLARPGSRPAE